MKQLAYITFLILLVAARAVAQEGNTMYEIDVVCQGTERYYRVNGEKGSSWQWKFFDADSTEVTAIDHSFQDFAARNNDGDSIWGSEIAITWAVDTGRYYLWVEQTSLVMCDSTQLGYVTVIPGPEGSAGDDIYACAHDIVELEDAWAANYSAIMWTSYGDGAFIDSSAVNAAYIPGPGDIASGNVTLSMVILGEGKPGACDMIVSSVDVFLSDPQLELVAVSPLCNSMNSGSVTATLTGGYAPFSFEWTGPEGFTSDIKDISNLAAGWYYLTVTDSLNCALQDSVEIGQPDELLIVIDSIGQNDCYGDAAGFARVAVSGGSGLYTYQWNTDPVQADSLATGLAAGIYIVTVTDVNGCEAGDTIEITQPEELLAEALPETLCETDSVQLIATVTGGTGDYTHAWSGDGAIWLNDTALAQPLFAGATAGTYEIIYTVTDEKGCTADDTIAVTVDPLLTRTEDMMVCETALPFDWYGNTINLPGTYTDTIPSVAGCDTIVTLNLIIEPLQKDTMELVVCVNELPYIWHGYTFSGDSTLTDTIASVDAGCDTIRTLVLRTEPLPTHYEELVVCQNELPYTWHGYEFTGDSTLTDTIPSVAAGCDTVRTLVLKVEPMLTRTDYAIVCESDLPYVWFGNNYTLAGIYTDTIPSAAGCDTIATLNLDIVPEFRDTIPMTVCTGNLPYEWFGQQITAAGLYEHILQTTAGCDSILTLNFDILPEFRDTIPMTVCTGNLPYEWFGQQITAAGLYEHILQTTAGCDSILTLNFDILPEFRDTIPMTVCTGNLPYEWFGQQITAAGLYEHTLTTTAGCDSILTLDFDITPEFRDTIQMEVCTGNLPYEWFGQQITAAGLYEHTLSTVAGCDSILTLSFDILPEFRDTIPLTVCTGNLPYEWFGQQITAAGLYEHTLTTTAGCDSILTLKFDIIPEFRDTIPMTVCTGNLPYEWFGQQITAAGLYEHILTTTAGCDSILTLDFDILPEFRDTIPMTVCTGNLPYEWFGQQITAAGLYEHILTTTAGCDSILTLNFDILPEFRDTIPMTVCTGNLPYEWFGQQITAAGLYEHTLQTTAGCDSILTLNFDITPEFRDTIPMTVCTGNLPYEWFGQQITAAGLYEHTLTTTAGCDSILTLNIDILPEFRDTIPMTVCTGSLPYDWYGQQITAAGLYDHILTTIAGCDSILTLNFDITPAFRDTIQMEVCTRNLPYDWYGQQITAAGLYEHTLSTVAGCDSILTLSFDILPEFRDTIPLTVCTGSLPYEWFGQQITAAGLYEHTLQTTAGCDSILTLNFDIIPEFRDTIPMTVCTGNLPYEWFGQQITAAGLYEHILTTIAGCDSILTLNFDITPAFRDTIQMEVCTGNLPYEWFGQQITAAGLYEHILTTTAGCDSVLTLNFDILPEFRDTIPMTVCTGSLPYEWFGQQITAAGLYEYTLQTAAGCDSILTLDFDILPEFRDTIPMTVCTGSLPYEWFGQQITAAGLYEHTLTTTAGCDSVLTLNFDIIPEFRNTIPMTVCTGNLPYEWFGQQITAAGLYEHTLTTTAGCDSILTLDFDILPEFRDTIPMTVCTGNLPYEWFGQQITAAGLYEHTLTTTAGCDSILTLHFDIIPAFRDTIQLEVCTGNLPYDWYGQQITAAGLYEYTLTTTAGCDSILTLEFDVVPDIQVTEELSICTNQLPFTWFGHVFSDAGTVVQDVDGTGGECDTIRTLVLNVLPELRDTIQFVVCESDLPYQWNGQNIVSEGEYQHAFASASGCDSIVVLVMVIEEEVPVGVAISADNTTILTGETVTFTATPVNGGNNPVYTWYVNNVEQTGHTSDTFAFEPADGDVVWVWVLSDHPCTNNNPARSENIVITVGAPGLTCPPTIYLECNVDAIPPAFTTFQEFMNGGGQVEGYDRINPTTFAYTQSETTGSCPDTITRTYSVKDNNGALLTCIQLIIINDTQDPWMDIQPKQVVCETDVPAIYTTLNEFILNGGTADDLCLLDHESFRFVDQSSDDNSCPKVITRIYEVYDMCGNRAQAEEIIGVHDDIAPVILACPADMKDQDKTLEELTGYPFAATETAIDLADTTALGISAYDNCGIREITWHDEQDGTCNPVITRTFTVYDHCGNKLECKQNITIANEVEPVFFAIGPVCQFTELEPLPTTSQNGITGTWNPATINTEVPGKVVLIFTPDEGQCALNDTMEVTVIEQIVPEFDPFVPYCQFEQAPALPETDKNGITGRWSPETIDTENHGTHVYLFIPDDSYECAQTLMVEIEVTEFISPVLAQVGPVCQFGVAPQLPLTDLNAVAGTWKPAVIDTQVAGTFEFVFTPDAESCFEPDTIEVVILPYAVPAFSLTDEICQFETAPDLPAVSGNGVPGSWSPAAINTDVAGVFKFIFTPDDSYPCSEPFEWTITVNTLIVPQFEAMGPFCQNSAAPALPAANFNGVTGRWNPSAISTATAGTFMYIFEPDEDFRCAETDTLWIEITPSLVPEFDPIGPLCMGETAPELPAVSLNGVTGTWEPAVISTETSGTFTFVFTPENDDLCAVETSIQVSVISNTPPVAVNDVAITVQDMAIEIDILANDTDESGIDRGSVTILKQPNHGTVTVDPVTGALVYTPESKFTGTEVIRYAVCDDGIPCGALCDTANVNITVRPPNRPPVARDDNYTVMCFPLIEYPLENDYDPDRDKIRIVPWPMVDVQHGTLTIQADGAFIYMPDEGYVGLDTFVYRIYDDGFPELWDEATVRINVLPGVDCDGLPEDPDVPAECSLLIPDGFSPNGDGVHDFFQVYCIEKYPEAVMRIFDRAGNKLFQKHNYGNINYWSTDENAWWWGNSEHKLTLGRGTLPAGTYLYVLELGNGEVRTGTVMIAY